MQWDKVLSVATPAAAAEDRVLIPYALLAHSERGTLPQNIFRYPVLGPEDIDLEGELTRHGYYFTSLVNECMGCTNEAIHNTFQAACTTPYGTSFGTLRQLIKFNIASGNKAMARKYCDVPTVMATMPSETKINSEWTAAALSRISAVAASSPSFLSA